MNVRPIIPGSPIAIRTEEVTGCSALQAYLYLRDHYGRDDAFILESLAGPGRDVKIAIVGFDKAAEISIKGRTLKAQGRGYFGHMLSAWAVACDDLEPAEDGFTIKPGRTWDALRSLHRHFALEGQTGLGFLAFFSYDAAWHIESLPRLIDDDWQRLPEVYLALHRGAAVFDLASGTGRLEWMDVAGEDAFPFKRFETEAASIVEPAAFPEIPVPERVSDSITKEAFEDATRRCLEHIAAGDIYQIQLGHEVRIRSKADPFDVYLRLRQINPSPYMYFAPVAGALVVGASPELFIRKEATQATMRPIAGTMRRTGDDAGDTITAAALREDEKERAEHIMLIDLCRNDLGRVCRPGTLVVDECMAVEAYSHVLHLVSNVQAELSPHEDVFSSVAATFPAGTMTGAPKIRAMELIESFESTRRSLYAGAGGIINLNGDATLALCIRTALFHGGEYSIRASAGIVADSNPSSEWQETLNKLAAAFIAITASDFQEAYSGG